MEKKGHETERGLWLKGWKGSDSHEISTISRKDVYMPHLCLSVLGSTQPQKWRTYVRSVMGEDAGNDGLLQRLQLLVWPDRVPDKYIDAAPDKAIAAQVEERLRLMLSIGADDPESTEPVVFRFSAEAQDVFVEWWDKLSTKRDTSDQTEAVLSHFAKYKSLMVSLALLFQLFDDGPRLFDSSVQGCRTPAPGRRECAERPARRAVLFVPLRSCNPLLQLSRQFRWRGGAERAHQGRGAWGKLHLHRCAPEALEGSREPGCRASGTRRPEGSAVDSVRRTQAAVSCESQGQEGTRAIVDGFMWGPHV
jgi:hypothetical protein